MNNAPAPPLRQAFRVFCLTAVASLFALSSPGPSGGRVVILNSDNSIEKYSRAQAAFREALAAPALDIDLGDRSLDERKVREILCREDPEIVYCIGSRALQLARTMVSEKKLVFSSVINWRRLGLGKGAFGVSNEMPPGAQLTLYRMFFPDIRKIGVLYSEAYNREWFASATRAAAEVGIRLVGKPVQKDPEQALASIIAEVDAVWLIADPVILSEQQSVIRLFEMATARKKAVITYDEVFADLGPALIISVDAPTIGRQAAGLAHRLVSGERVEERIQNPGGTSVILNLKKVAESGLRLNEEALDSVDRIIQ